MTLVASSCTDVLDQMPTTEDTSKMFMLKRQIIREFLPKYMPRMFLQDKDKVETTETSPALTSKTFPVAISICKKPLPMK